MHVHTQTHIRKHARTHACTHTHTCPHARMHEADSLRKRTRKRRAQARVHARTPSSHARTRMLAARAHWPRRPVCFDARPRARARLAALARAHFSIANRPPPHSLSSLTALNAAHRRGVHCPFSPLSVSCARERCLSGSHEGLHPAVVGEADLLPRRARRGCAGRAFLHCAEDVAR